MRTSAVNGRAPARPEPVVIAGTAVDRILLTQLPDIVEQMIGSHRRASTDYRRLPPEVLQNDVKSVSTDAVRFYARWLREGASATPKEHDRLADSAARRAEEGLPLEAVLSAYCRGIQGLYLRLTDAAGDQDLESVRELGARLFDCLREAVNAVTGGYVDEVRQRAGAEQDAKQILFSALLDENPSALVDNAVASRYLVLNLALGRHPDELRPGINTTILGRRVAGRLHKTIAAATDDQAMTSLNGRGGIVLVPVEDGFSRRHWADVLTAAEQAAGVPVTAVVAVAAPDRIRATAVQNADVLDVLRWFERPPGLYGLDDVLVEYQLTRPGPARRRLAATLEPLDHHPELAETLSCYVENAENRRRTATRLNVHPNTVDYRLRRVSEVVGRDVTEPSGMHHVMAALAARRAEGTSFPRESVRKAAGE
ncbi:PucR family transcriptional regulator [Amycolatopsis sp. RTGN1]|uniref:PucR family transcriptional regulator n=1 Tax=Amycolatopsis ponsaeliensis TaxID=2992142 RepID=UPI00254FED97|nr:helix-turn-helix domain-containing protein [Amycolatopsis sp. RTGN1]